MRPRYAQIIEIYNANSLLSIFGSAKTEKNNNSTRASRHLRLFFLHKKIVGFRFTNFYLEKNRLVFCSKGESIFHVFRMMAEGLSPEERSKYGLEGSLMDYRLIRDACKEETNYKYAKKYQVLKHAFKVGFAHNRYWSSRRRT